MDEPMHRLLITVRKVVTACGVRVSAHYPEKRNGQTRDGDLIRCSTDDRVRATCPKCRRRLGMDFESASNSATIRSGNADRANQRGDLS
jgi:hypothetical protein